MTNMPEAIQESVLQGSTTVDTPALDTIIRQLLEAIPGALVRANAH
jgi:hypothetical protein